MGCGQTLVRQAKRPETREWLALKCIHGDIKEYTTKIISLEIENVKFFCRAGVVAQLGVPVLIERDCPIFKKLVNQSKELGICPNMHQIMAAEEPGIPVPVNPRELAQLTCTYTTLEHACQAVTQEAHLGYTDRRFVWKGPLLYWIDREAHQLVRPMGLRQRLLYLVHEIPLVFLSPKKCWPGSPSVFVGLALKPK